MRAGWARRLVCSRDGVTGDVSRPAFLSPAGLPWLVDYDLAGGEAKGRWLQRELGRRPWSMWRYRELLPIEDLATVRYVGEGGTPVYPVTPPAGCTDDLKIWAKEEAGNPGGSFKARGMALAAARARELGATGLELASAGNAAIALALFASVNGLKSRVAVPTDTPRRVIESCRRFGAEVVEAGASLVEAAAALGQAPEYWNVSTLREPYRLEGKKTMGLELAEQFSWRLPDWILYPTGGGTGLIGMHKAFSELRALGLLKGGQPRFVAVQMEGCAPIVRAFERGEVHAAPWESPRTEVYGLRVPRAIGDFLILKVLRETRGLAMAVGEERVREEQARLARERGLDWGPEGTACWVALRELVARQVFAAGERVVLFQTGDPGNYR